MRFLLYYIIFLNTILCSVHYKNPSENIRKLWFKFVDFITSTLEVGSPPYIYISGFKRGNRKHVHSGKTYNPDTKLCQKIVCQTSRQKVDSWNKLGSEFWDDISQLKYRKPRRKDIIPIPWKYLRPFNETF